jgi:SOS-response transcriptional repressor LexA
MVFAIVLLLTFAGFLPEAGNPAFLVFVCSVSYRQLYDTRQIEQCQVIYRENFAFLGILMDYRQVIEIAEKLIENKGLDRSKLARELGLGSRYVADIKSGKSKKPSSDFALALINKLNFNPAWLQTGEGEMLTTPTPPNLENSLIKGTSGTKVPLLRQKVSCGVGMHWESEQNIQGYIDIFDMIPRLQIKRIFALCVEGSSMLGAGICDGDYVFFDGEADNLPHDGIYVFALDGDVYCKRLEFEKITKKIKIFSVRTADLEKAELLTTLDMEDTSVSDRLEIFGRVVSWVHPNLEE